MFRAHLPKDVARLVEPEMRAAYWNPGALRGTGMRAVELLGAGLEVALSSRIASEGTGRRLHREPARHAADSRPNVAVNELNDLRADDRDLQDVRPQREALARRGDGPSLVRYWHAGSREVPQSARGALVDRPETSLRSLPGGSPAPRDGTVSRPTAGQNHKNRRSRATSFWLRRRLGGDLSICFRTLARGEDAGASLRALVRW